MQFQAKVAEHAVCLTNNLFLVDEALQLVNHGEKANPYGWVVTDRVSGQCLQRGQAAPLGSGAGLTHPP